MRLFNLAFLLLFISVSAQANLAGTWAGPAVYTNVEGETEDIELELGITLSESSIQIDDVTVWTFLPESADIMDGQLMIEGEVVGSISADKIMIDYTTQDEIMYEATLSLNADGKLSFEDKATIDGQSDSVAGVLDKMERAIRSLPVFGNRLGKLLN